jgi:AraC-like DNA-binding protein
MAVLFDTKEIPRADRLETWRAAMSDAVLPMNLHIPDSERLTARVEVWELGSLRLVRADSNVGMSMALTPRQAAQRDEPLLSVGLALCAGGRYEQFGTQRDLPDRGLHGVDLSSTFTYARATGGPSLALTCMTAEELGLPLDSIRRAIPKLHESHLYPLVRQHAELINSPALAVDPAAAELGAATVELVRALFASASNDPHRGRDLLAESLVTRIRTYVRIHLRDPELCPDQIAAAHHISRRYLFRLCRDAGLGLEQWIITQRLAGARTDLARASERGRTIAAVARHWGFADPAHFSRRFRDEYSLTPREWRHLALAADSATGTPA